MPVSFACCFDDGTGVNALMDMKGHVGDLKRGMFGLARPLQAWVNMRVISICILSGLFIRIRSNQTNRRIIDPLFPFVIVLLNRLLPAGSFCFSCHEIYLSQTIIRL